MNPLKLLQNILFLTLSLVFTGLPEHCEVLLDLDSEVSIVDSEAEEEKAKEAKKLLGPSEALQQQIFSEKQMHLLHLTESNYLFDFSSELDQPPDFKVV